MRTNEKVWTVATAVASVAGAALLGMCSPDAEATVPREPRCCDPVPDVYAYADGNGNAVIVGKADMAVTHAPGQVIDDEGRLAAEIGPRCMKTVKAATGRYADRYFMVVCMEREVFEGDYVSPPETPTEE